MYTLREVLEENFFNSIKKSFNVNVEKTDVEIFICLNEKFGHYQCNNALKLSKVLKKSPREIAQTIIDNLDKDIKGILAIKKAEVAGGGFINITLSNGFLSNELTHMFRSKLLGAKQSSNRDKVIVEFSSPNIAKELHVGHLRSTIIGDCIARLLEFLSYDVLRLNHIGDWGTQFGMLIAYIKLKHPTFMQSNDFDLTMLTKLYKNAKQLFDEDGNFKKDSQLEVVRLQAGKKESMNIWQAICNVSRKAFKEIYDILDTKIIERGESFYNPYLQEIMDDLENKKMIQISDGAKCVFLKDFKNREGNPLPLIMQKSDGGFNYNTTDMAGFRNRCFDENASRIIIITDTGQSTHFQMIYEAVVKARYIDPKKTKFDHVPFGLVLGEDGKKFKTRSGKTEKLIDLLYMAIDKAKNVIKARLPELKEEELEKCAKILGIGAVKYADLSCHRIKDYNFSYDRMLKFEGNTIAFLLYSYVRIRSIKRKIKSNIQEILKTHSIEITHDSEMHLGVHLRRFGEVLENFKNDLLPNRLCEYLYNLAEKFNVFFRDCRVEGDEKQSQRLVLCELTGNVLKTGLHILGISTLDKM